MALRKANLNYLPEFSSGFADKPVSPSRRRPPASGSKTCCSISLHHETTSAASPVESQRHAARKCTLGLDWETVAELRVHQRERIEALAYSFAQARGMAGGYAKEDWYRAEAIVTYEDLNRPGEQP